MPKPKVAVKPVAPTPDPALTLQSARSLSKLNDLDHAQLTYRTNHSILPGQSTNRGAPSTHLTNYHLANQTTQPVHLANQMSYGGSYMPHSYSSPVLSQTADNVDVEQFDYLDTIEMLHKRHLEEKRLIAGVRQKI